MVMVHGLDGILGRNDAIRKSAGVQIDLNNMLIYPVLNGTVLFQYFCDAIQQIII